MSKPKLRYAICDFDTRKGVVLDKNGSLQWYNGTVAEATTRVEKRKAGICALFFPGDVPQLGCPPYRQVTREDFEEHPGRYGVCYYKAACGFRFE